MATPSSGSHTAASGDRGTGVRSADLMKYTRSETPPDNYVQGYTMHHGIAPNGGGTLVNQWTDRKSVVYGNRRHDRGGRNINERHNGTGFNRNQLSHEQIHGVGLLRHW